MTDGIPEMDIPIRSPLRAIQPLRHPPLLISIFIVVTGQVQHQPVELQGGQPIDNHQRILPTRSCIAIKHLIDQQFDDPTPIENLWIAVIKHAVYELSSRNKKISESAKRFIFGQWLDPYAKIIGLSPDWIRKLVKDAIEKENQNAMQGLSVLDQDRDRQGEQGGLPEKPSDSVLQGAGTPDIGAGNVGSDLCLPENNA